MADVWVSQQRDCRNRANCFFTNPNAEPMKVDIGLTIVTKLQGEKGEQTTHHYAEEVTRNGIAEQLGIRKHDELWMLNFFPLSGKTQEEVIQLFADEILGPATELFFKRREEIGENFYHHFHHVTSILECLEQEVIVASRECTLQDCVDGGFIPQTDITVEDVPHLIVASRECTLQDCADGGFIPQTDNTVEDVPHHHHEKELLLEYRVNYIRRQIVRDSEVMYVTIFGYLRNVESERYLCYDNNMLVACDGFDNSDKYLFAILVNLLNSEAFIGHRMGPPMETEWAFMEEQSNTKVDMRGVMTTMLQQDESVPRDPDQGDKMLMLGVSNHQRLYAFRSITTGREQFYLSTHGCDVVLKELHSSSPSEDTHLQFQLFPQDSLRGCKPEEVDGHTVEVPVI